MSERYEQLKEMIERVVPYVMATLAKGNSLQIHEMEGYGDPAEWRAVHAGRADSSIAQLNGLLKAIHGSGEPE